MSPQSLLDPKNLAEGWPPDGLMPGEYFLKSLDCV